MLPATTTIAKAMNTGVGLKFQKLSQDSVITLFARVRFLDRIVIQVSHDHSGRGVVNCTTE